MNYERVILIILDGFGNGPKDSTNAIYQAKKPTLDHIASTYPSSELWASESHVGLPDGFMGNSEVGHLNIGAGRLVYQDFSMISKAITDKSFFSHPILIRQLKKIQNAGGALHLLGLLSDGGVHSHISHLFALITMALPYCKKIWLHLFLDGRDTPPTSGKHYLKEVENFIVPLNAQKLQIEIATLAGRYYAMDRDKRWERVLQAEKVIRHGKNETNIKITSPIEYVLASYEKQITDEFIIPIATNNYPGIQKNDGAIFFNFRPDRARELTQLLTEKPSELHKGAGVGLDFSSPPEWSSFVTMTEYMDTSKTTQIPYLFEKKKIEKTLGEIISNLGIKQLRIAETEKYAHVTYFFNGGSETPFEGEKRILIPSPKEVPTYDLKPEMSAYPLTDKLLEELQTQSYGFALVNYANPDMVGHTGNLFAAIQAIEVIDTCLGNILKFVENTPKTLLIITSDHGNAEVMLQQGLPLTSHTLLPVPFYVVDPLRKKNITLQPKGSLSDIAPTLLKLWGIPIPPLMTGKALAEMV